MLSSRTIIYTLTAASILLLAALAMPAQHRPGATKKGSQTEAEIFEIPDSSRMIPWKGYKLAGKWEGPEGYDATWVVFHQNKQFELHKFSRSEPMFITNEMQEVTWQLDTTKTPAWIDIVIKMKSEEGKAKIRQMTGSDTVRMLGIISILDQNNMLLTINTNPFKGERPTAFRKEAVGTMAMTRVLNWKEGDVHRGRSQR